MKGKNPNDQEPLSELTPDMMQRYAQGTLSAGQRKRVEVFLEQNPFAAEALEGLQATSGDFLADLMELEDRLKEKTHSNPTKITRFYWPMAAAISLLIISGFILYLLLPNQQESSQIAVNQELSEDESENPITTKSQPNSTPGSILETKTEQENISETNEIEDKEVENKQEGVIDQPQQLEGTTSEESIETNPEPEEATTDAVSTDATELNEPVPQRSKLNADDTSDNLVTVDLETQETKSQEATPKAFNKRANKEKAPSVASVARTTVTTPELPVASAPESIRAHIYQNLKYPDDARTQGIKGIVKLTFMVNTDGSLSNFLIIHGLGHGCDEEAIKVIEMGPAWKPAEINGIPVKSKGEIDVKFPPEK
jgi:TonB family protein